MIARKQALDVVIQALGFIESSVSYSNGLHLYDANVISEHFFTLFLSKAYKQNFINLNTGTRQQPAIDLGDLSAGICFQVTSDGKKSKIEETVDRYMKHKLFNKFPHLRVFIIGRRHGRYGGIAVPAGVTFNVDDDVIGCPELVKHINTLGTPQIQKLESIIYRELPVFRKATDVQNQNDEDAIDEYRSYFDRPALHDPWRAEGDYAAFGKALTDLIQLLNTGWVDGVPVTKKRMKVSNNDWKGRLSIITAQLLALRQIFTIHVRTGEIDLDRNRCSFKDQRVPGVIDHYKEAILSEMNLLLTMAGVPKIP